MKKDDSKKIRVQFRGSFDDLLKLTFDNNKPKFKVGDKVLLKGKNGIFFIEEIEDFKNKYRSHDYLVSLIDSKLNPIPIHENDINEEAI